MIQEDQNSRTDETTSGYVENRENLVNKIWSPGMDTPWRSDRNETFDPDGNDSDAKSVYEKRGYKWKTDLGYTMDVRDKLTLRDLGAHISEDLKKVISQDRINEFGGYLLGAPFEGGGAIAPGVTAKDLTELYTALVGEAKDFNDIGDSVFKEQGYRSGGIGKLTKQQFLDNYVDNQSGLKLGESKVLNPDFQFNELDDVRADYRRPKIGRLYAERIYDYNLPIVYFQPGIIKIDTAGIELMANLSIQREALDAASYLRDEGNNIFTWGIKKMGAVMHNIISLGARQILDYWKWFKWVPQSVKYFKFVNDFLVELAVWFGVIGERNEAQISMFDQQVEHVEKFANEQTGERTIDNTPTGIFGHVQSFWNKTVMKTISSATDDVDVPQLLSDDNQAPPGSGEDGNYSIAEGITAMYGYIGDTPNHSLSALHCLPQYMKLHNNAYGPDKRPADGGEQGFFTGVIKDLAWLVAETMVPFAIGKGVSVSESFSNSTQTHPLVSSYNAAYEESNQLHLVGDKGLSLSEGAGASFIDSGLNIGGNLLNYGKNKLGDMMANTMASMGLGGEAGMVMSGQSRFLLPEVWNDSSVDRNYNISFKLRSPYGNRLAIFENTMIPLAFLLSMTLSRQVGLMGYTNPFYVKAFSKGLFSCEYGMITSLSINRGDDKNDRTVEGFFRSISISMSIKDIMANMSMALDGGIFSVSAAANTAMQNYICNLAGISQVEKANFAKKWNKMAVSMKSGFDNFGSNTRVWFGEAIRGTPIIGKVVDSYFVKKHADIVSEDRKYQSSY